MRSRSLASSPMDDPSSLIDNYRSLSRWRVRPARRPGSTIKQGCPAGDPRPGKRRHTGPTRGHPPDQMPGADDSIRTSPTKLLTIVRDLLAVVAAERRGDPAELAARHRR